MTLMDLNSIKKELYKQKPVAEFICAQKGGLWYDTILENNWTVLFKIPFDDIGDANFTSQMSAQLLIRYIVEQKQIKP